MNSRLLSRLLQLLVLGLRFPQKLFRKKPSDSEVHRVLVIHQLLLGDAVMATGLLANIRAKYPSAAIHVAMPEFLVPLYQNMPFGVTAIPYTPRQANTLLSLIKKKTYDVSYVVGDARYSWAAFAAGSRWIVAHEGDYPAYKNWFVDELVPMPKRITAMPDLMIDLCSPDVRVNYGGADWQQSDTAIDTPEQPYVVMHVGASSSLKLWASDNWRCLAKEINKLGYAVVVTCGPGEEDLIQEFLNNEYVDQVIAGNYSLLQMWQLIKNAELLVSPDTGISHIAKVTNTPLVCIFGPGPYELVGSSIYFQNHRGHYISKPIHCRDQPVIFKRPVSWLKFCERSESQCSEAKCIKVIGMDDVFKACSDLLDKK